MPARQSLYEIRGDSQGPPGGLDATVLNMGVKHLVGGLIALSMMIGGGFLALAGLGYVGGSGDTSRSWAVVGSLFAGLGVALVITMIQRR